MPYLTETKLESTIDLPVALPATELIMGDWLIFASIRLLQPHKLRYRMLNMQLHYANVDIADISSGNLTYGNLGLAYVVLRRDYTSGSPGIGGALDTLVVTELGVVARDIDNEIEIITPGLYSWIIANNCKADSTSAIPASTNINFRLSVTGQIRMELDAA